MSDRSTEAESKKPARKASGSRRLKSPYFLQPSRGGGVTVFRRPSGNRALPKNCGTVPTRALAAALVRQLQEAESVLNDLFLEATDDGIEALEAVLIACQNAVMANRGATSRRPPRGSGRPVKRRGDRGEKKEE